MEIIAPDRTIQVFRFKPYMVVSRSMEPKILKDDMVLVRRTDIQNLNEGDIITFRADILNTGQKEIVTHYILSIEEIEPGRFEIKTHRFFENQEDIVEDAWILSEEDIIGVHALTVPRVGLIIRFLRSPQGIAAMALNMIIIIAIISLLKKDDKNQKDKL